MGKVNNKSQLKVSNKLWYFLFTECQKGDKKGQIATNYKNLDNQMLQTNTWIFYLYHKWRKSPKMYPQFYAGDNPVLLTKLLEVTRAKSRVCPSGSWSCKFLWASSAWNGGAADLVLRLKSRYIVFLEVWQIKLKVYPASFEISVTQSSIICNWQL